MSTQRDWNISGTSKERDERLRMAVEVADIGVWELELGGECLAASAGFRSHLDLSGDGLVPLGMLRAAVDPDDRADFTAALRRSMGSGQPLDVEFRHTTAAGRERWIRLKARLHGEPHGSGTLVGVSLDVTDQHRTADELHRMQTLIRGVLETETGLIYAKDRDGRMLMANPSALNLIGKPWAQVQGRTDAEFLNDPKQAEALMQNDFRVMVGGKTEVLEEYVDCPDGRTAVWLSTKSPLRDAAGCVVGLVGVSQDISRQKTIERQLLELNETLEQKVAARTRERDRAWNNSQDLQLIIDADGIIEAVNPAWTVVLGYSADELKGHSFLEFLHPDHLPANQEALVVARDTRLQRHENRYLHKDGSYRWIEWVTAPDGNRIYASGRHVTTEKEAAAALATKAEQLELSNRELESFSYSVSHDLRSPIRAIDGFAHILADEHSAQLDAEGRRLLAAIQGNSHRMGLLIDDLLAFSRAGHLPLACVEVDVQSLVNDVITELTRDMPASRLTIRRGRLASVRGDRSMLRQVWTNLISNAIKYSGKNPDPCIAIASEHRDDGVEFSIRDNGVGFDMRYAAKLFGVFQRLHNETEFKGTGVGLALAQRIVNRHGGRIWADSTPDQGASFYFTIPA